MSELKLRRLTEHNQRLREDLTRPRVRVSEASARCVPPFPPLSNYSMMNRVLQSHSVLQNHQRPFGTSLLAGVQPLTPPVAVARLLTRVFFFADSFCLGAGDKRRRPLRATSTRMQLCGYVVARCRAVGSQHSPIRGEIIGCSFLIQPGNLIGCGVSLI